MDEANTSYVLQSERMGHEVPGMRGVYSHVTPRMRSNLVDALQGMWETSVAERAKLYRVLPCPSWTRSYERTRAAKWASAEADRQDPLPLLLPNSDTQR